MSYEEHYEGADCVICWDRAVQLFGALIRTIAYQPSSIAGFQKRAEELTGGKPPVADDDYEAVAELFVQVCKVIRWRTSELSELSGGKVDVTVGKFLDRVGALLDVDSVTKAMEEPESVRTLDNIPVSLN